MDPITSKQKGFSLIELMIAIFVSLLIIAGLFYSVIGDLKSYESARATQGLVSKSRMAVQTLRLYIQQAGFRDIDALKQGSLYSAETSSSGWVWQEGQILQGTTTTTVVDDAKSDSDILAIRFSGATQSGIVSCDGTHLLTDDTNEITLYVNSSDQLMCKDNNDDAVLLDENIEFLELLYGTSDNTTRYFSAADVSDWDTVNRIKVGMLVSQQVENNSLTNNNSFTIFNQNITAAGDSNYRTVAMETVLIGNQGE